MTQIILVVLLLTLLPASLRAASKYRTVKTFKITVRSDIGKESFRTIESGDQVFLIKESPGQKNPRKKQLSILEADQLANEANRILWKTAYKEHNKPKNCKEYVEISLFRQVPKSICKEHQRASGHIAGFLNRLETALTQ